MKSTYIVLTILAAAVATTVVVAQDAKKESAPAAVCTPESIKQDCEGLNKYYTDQFVSSVGFGYDRMVNVEKVVSTRQWSIGQENYVVKGIQLISLLKHDPAVVYPPVTYTGEWNHKQNPPTPAKIGNEGTRSLNDFETAALKQLKEKKENMAVPGDMVMVGALRAESSCLKCHDCTEGDLLGAFTYILQKAPASAPSTPGAPVKTSSSTSSTGASSSLQILTAK